MLQRTKAVLLFVLGFGLPLHGILTVFTPDAFRWWKEGILLLLSAVVILSLVQNLFNNNDIDSCLRRNDKRRLLNHPMLLAFLWLLWGLFLVVINKDLHTALVAFRYLGLGVFAALLGYGLWRSTFFSGKNGYLLGLKFFHNFCTGLLLGVILSTALGLWAKFLGGFEVLQTWYSTTISSWVPGQTIPLYHQVGDFIRLQGGSSGPVEYAHLAVLGVWYVLFFTPCRHCKALWMKTALICFLGFGIWQSGSRAAWLGLIILLLCFGWLQIKSKWQWPAIKWRADKLAALLLVVIVLTAMIKFTASKAILGDIDLLNKNIIRVSDIDHVKRPLEAFNKALEHPLVGNLGALGPAARAKNLAVHNKDQALIAESVPFDVMAQLGFIGFILWSLFFITLYGRASEALRALMLAFVPMILLATIFDMSPVAISFYLILGLGLVWPQIRKADPTDFNSVFTLKKLAFKRYIEAVWGWREAEQEKFVTQELCQGGIYLVWFEGQVVGTYCLVPADKATQLFSFYIHPAYQSLGLGSVILNTIITAEPLRLSVLKVNFLAKAFYESHGFKVEGEDEFHWHLSRTI